MIYNVYILKEFIMRKHGKEAGEFVAKAVKEWEAGTLKSGKSGELVESREQAIAIGLSEARKAGIKVPKQPEEETY